MDILGDPKEIVADSAPIPLMGTLEDGREVSILDASLVNTDISRRQVVAGTRLLVGLHVPHISTTFDAARVALPSPRQWYGLLAEQGVSDCEIGDNAGRLKNTVGDDGELWIELTLGNGLSEREWERRFWNRCLTYLRLWTNVPLREGRVMLRREGGEWHELFVVGGTRPNASPALHKSLLPPHEVTREGLSKALELFDFLAPVPDIASRHLVYEVTLELAVLANAACLEGLHRSLHGKGKLMPTLSNKKAEVIATAAAEAAASAAIELGAIVPEQSLQMVASLKDAFRFFNQLTFADRLAELLPPVRRIAPGLIGQDQETWIRKVVSTRNLEAHRLQNQPAIYEARNDDYHQIAISTEWVLRISMLLALDVDEALLASRLRSHERFEFDLANMDRCDYPWPGSRIDEYRASETPGQEAAQ